MQLPKEFIDRTKLIVGEEWNDFMESLNSDSPTSIRLNRTKVYQDFFDFKQVPWCNTGYYLSQRPQFTFDPLFHIGMYYVQEASSMIIGKAIEQLVEGDVKCLDLCAAPGGKSTLISSLISEDSLLVSNEIIGSRANILSENMMKWGNPNSIVTNNKPEDLKHLYSFFDLILVDAPCSGEGMFRKDHQAIDEWSVDNVKLCADRQKNIISSIWNNLKSEGYLLYSTCTYNREENEEIVSWILENYDTEIVELEIKEEWGITISEVKGRATYRFFPHKTKGEGLYFAIIKKVCEGNNSTKNKYKKGNDKSRVKSKNYELYLQHADCFNIFEHQGAINAFLSNRYDDFMIIKDSLNIISAGICLGQVKGKDFLPHQSLALSTKINLEAFDKVEVDWNTAISYLRSEAIFLTNAAKGIILLTYQNIPLGFVKNIGSRANNMYPNAWRIRSANPPSKRVDILSI